jgi:hypothetical protein
VTLTDADWKRLYKEMSLLAHRMTFTKDPKQQWTARDRAQEAVQKACLRYLEVRPAGLDTLADVRHYLAGALRSTLGHASERAATRQETEGEAAAEEVHLTGGATPSAETMNLEAKQQVVDLRRSRRLMRRLRRKLRDANDTIGLGMLDCIAKGHTAAEDQARILECTVEDIYNARKRRNRAKDEVLAEYTDEGDDEENE